MENHMPAGSSSGITRQLRDLLGLAPTPAPMLRPTTVELTSAAQHTALLELLQAAPPTPDTTYPLALTCYVGGDIVVRAGEPLVLGEPGPAPVLYTYDTLTLEPGAQIQCTTAVVLTVSHFIKQ